MVKEQEKAGFDQQFMSGVTFPAVLQQGQDTGGDGLVERRVCGVERGKGFLSIEEREDIFIVAGVILDALEDSGVKHDVKVFSGLIVPLVDGMEAAGEDYDHVSTGKCKGLSPYSDQDPASDTVD